MSRVLVKGDGGEHHHHSTGEWVYVNNMNTLHATVSLPERMPYSLCERNMEAPGSSTTDYVGSRVVSTNTPHGRLQQSPETQRAFADSQSTAEQQRGAIPLTASGEPVHANLQGVYNRIMRRLQRQMNYAELSRASLADQYGIDLQLACEQDHQDLKAAELGRQRGTKHRSRTSSLRQPTSTATSPIKPVPNDSETDTASRPTSCLFTGYHVSPATIKIPEYAAPRPRGDIPTTACTGGGNGSRITSRLIQFKQTDTRSRASDTAGGIVVPAATNMSDVPGSGEPAAGAEGDDELVRDIEAQPCPLPLRLVIQNVLGTLQKKLSLAEGGSLKDCIVFAFESRALLDRLLKEIPLYSQYSAIRGTAGVATTTAATAAAQQDIAQVYQALRKKPVLLPRADYVEDPVTGAIRGQILGGSILQRESARASGAMAAPAAAVSLPAIVSSSRDFNTGDAVPPGAFTGGTGALADVQLPSGYGKSSRLHDATPQGGAATAAGAGCVGRQTQRHQVLRDHMTRGSAAGCQNLSSVSEATAAQSSVPVMMEATGNYSIFVGSSAAPPSSAFAAAHRATRLVSVGTVTEANNLTTVSKADYEALHERMEMLEAQLADAQMHRTALTDQLCEEAQYTDQKRRVLQYLRETLVRECTMLRSQLRLASSRVQLLQQHSQHQPLRGAVAFSAANEAHIEVPNTSVTVGGSTHMHKQLGASTALPMALSMSEDWHGSQHRSHSQWPSAQQLNMSGTIGSVYGGISGSGRRRLLAKQRHRNGSSVSPGASLSAIPPAMGSPAAGISAVVVSSSGVAGTVADGQQPNDLEAVQSLLDLVLLAVEEDAVIPSHALQMLRTGHADADLVKSRFRKDAKQQIDALRSEHDERQHALKKCMAMRTAEHKHLIAEQKHEVERLRALTDTTRVHAILQQHISDFRTELHKLRMYVTEQLHFFKTIMQNTAQSLLRRSALVDKTLSENVNLTTLISAMREVIESAAALLTPMLTNEYRCGYHPWPLKLRNTTDPLAHVIQLRYGPSEVIHLRDSLSIFGQLYSALHRYILRQIVLPDCTRPSAGRPLQYLCAALALNPRSHTDVIFAARHAYDAEARLCKRLARLNFRLMWNAHMQRVYTNRSVTALMEAGLNPHLSALPVAGRVNNLAKELAALLQARVAMQRERAENAKGTYRLWKEKEIDIMEGYPMPQTQRNRLALLSDGASGCSNTVVVGIGGNVLDSMMRGQRNTGSLGNFSKTFGRASMARSEGPRAATM
ncbi:hypothetical protein Q4I28_001911 [Leishmania naiffi]|uniref:Uncharacterized protein n=1 Tax=Leishmania naiffi TaxID=5678 RepID=A0AAW3C192_9TRYP